MHNNFVHGTCDNPHVGFYDAKKLSHRFFCRDKIYVLQVESEEGDDNASMEGHENGMVEACRANQGSIQLKEKGEAKEIGGVKEKQMWRFEGKGADVQEVVVEEDAKEANGEEREGKEEES